MPFAQLIYLTVFVAVTSFAAEREVVLNWEETPGAKSYQVEVSKESGEIVKRLNFKKSTFAVPLQVGNYLLRARSLDSRSVPGPWSEWEPMLVPPPLATFNKTPQRPLVASGKSLTARLPLAWAGSAATETYKLVVEDSAGKIIFDETTAETKKLLELPPGNYKVRLSSFTAGIEGAEKSEFEVSVRGAKMSAVEIQDPRLLENGTEFAWSEAPTGANYTVQLERSDIDLSDNEGWQSVYSSESHSDNKLLIESDLTPGRYRLRIAAAADGWQTSSASLREFVIKPQRRHLSSIDEELKSAFDFSEISK